MCWGEGALGAGRARQAKRALPAGRDGGESLYVMVRRASRSAQARAVVLVARTHGSRRRGIEGRLAVTIVSQSHTRGIHALR